MVGFLSDPNQFKDKFYSLLIKDHTDHPSIKKRMDILEEMLKDNRVSVQSLVLESNVSVFLKIFSSLSLADWTTYYLAKEYGIDPLDIDLIEEFKKKLNV